ncbi:hypothetical protein FOZ63_018747, partial [Perkinsus olseni]
WMTGQLMLGEDSGKIGNVTTFRLGEFSRAKRVVGISASAVLVKRSSDHVQEFSKKRKHFKVIIDTGTCETVLPTELFVTILEALEAELGQHRVGWLPGTLCCTRWLLDAYVGGDGYIWVRKSIIERLPVIVIQVGAESTFEVHLSRHVYACRGRWCSILVSDKGTDDDPDMLVMGMRFFKEYDVYVDFDTGFIGLATAQTPVSSAELGKAWKRRMATIIASANDIQKPDTDYRQYRAITLPNKMQALLIHDPKTEKAAACLAVKVGSMFDPPQYQGIAHFLEHMLFLGTEKYPEEDSYNKYLAQNGGRSNAFTSDTNTVYFFTVNSGALDGALDRFSYFFKEPLFTQSATDREVQAVNSENSKNLQADVWRMMQLERELVFNKEHPSYHFATKISVHDSTYKLWLKSQLYVIISRVREMNDIIFVGQKRDGLEAIKVLLVLSTQWDGYSSNIMKLAVIGTESLDELQESVLE